jgi:hypothetical protein
VPLREFGIDRAMVAPYAALMPQLGELAVRQRRRAWRTSPTNPPWTLEAAQAAESARHLTRSTPAGSTHLLYTALQHPDGGASQLMREFSVDPHVLRSELAHRVRR